MSTPKINKRKSEAEDTLKAENQMDTKRQKREANKQNLLEQLDANKTKLETYTKLSKASKERL